METIDGSDTECGRCGMVVPLADVVVLEREANEHMEKPLCGECFEAVGVPKGYGVKRDVTYLER